MPLGYYNLTGLPIRAGKKSSEETKRKQSNSHKGKRNTVSLKNLNKNAFKGGHHTEQWKKEHSEWLLKNSNRKGKTNTKEHREKISIALKGKYVGDKSPHWKGGGNDGLNNVIKKSYKYRQWRSDVFTKDNWTCICGNKRNIQAHHLEGFTEIIKKYNIKTIEEAFNCEKLWDINNGITLCFNCHCKKHIKLRNLKNHFKSMFPEI